MAFGDETTVLLIIGTVAVVIVAGMATLSKEDAPTAHVILDDRCGACEGTPVCAAKGKWVLTYESACAASCDGAREVFQGPCDTIPVA